VTTALSPSFRWRFIILMGLRGCGKSTLGPLLASQLPGYSHVDLDSLVAGRGGFATPAEFIAREGLAAFRAAETASLRLLLHSHARRSHVVISLGGGTPTAPGAAPLLLNPKRSGFMFTIYLHASPAALRARLENSDLSERPALTGANALDEIPTLYALRDALYRSLARVVIESEHSTPQQTVDVIHRSLQAPPPRNIRA
jgi:shikimate kinase